MSHSKTHQLTLQPTDVLFFKDGRPMEGSSSGHGAAWPMPNVIDSAIHAALRRAEQSLDHIHSHTPKRNGTELEDNRTRHFGSLQSAGPFPIVNDTWYFPRPADADAGTTATTTHKPLSQIFEHPTSTIEDGLTPVVNTQPPNKDTPEKWMSLDAYQAYLKGESFEEEESDEDKKKLYLNDAQIFAAEHNIGIGIDPSTGTQDGKSFYSASYLRLKDNAQLGLISKCQDKNAGDIINTVFPNSGTITNILAGGQQRTCGVKRNTPSKLPLPKGQCDKFKEHNGKRLVRWTLLTPAIFPKLSKTDKHPGGWLPTWIDPETKEIKLKDPSLTQRQKGERRDIWRSRIKNDTTSTIGATLVASIIPRPIPITGWSLGHHDNQGGARATHLAVPAGAVYYFEANDETEAKKLATALNWHGTTDGTEIINRRSTLLGEKGFGIGVCSPWNYHNGTRPEIS